MSVGTPGLCLRNFSHPVRMGEVLCRQCGSLVQGAEIGPYQVNNILGGNRGYQVYLAMTKNQRQPVIIKLFPSQLVRQHLWERVWREIHLLSGLRDSSILPVLNCTFWHPESSGSENAIQGPLFFVVVTPYVPMTLRDVLPGKGAIAPRIANLSLKRILRLIEQISTGLSLAHSLGIMYGALEPENIALNEQLDQLWISDFGVARLQLPRQSYLAPELLAISRLCEQNGDITPYWDRITPASDQYSLAVICSQLLGHTVSGETYQRVLPVLQQALQSNPALRFQRITDFSSALAAGFGVGQIFVSDSGSSLQQKPSRTTGRIGDIPPLSTNRPLLDTGLPSPTQQVHELEERAGKAFSARDYEAARKAYLQATSLDPANSAAWMGLADTYFALELYKEALAAYLKTLALDPNNAEAWFNCGTVSDLLGHSEQALRHYEKAEQLRAEAKHHRS